ncbi:MAG TPA: hypothetical protein VNT03_21380 [Baekduia sp.]|nr:hypothetical protein [Baekduia sp.]
MALLLADQRRVLEVLGADADGQLALAGGRLHRPLLLVAERHVDERQLQRVVAVEVHRLAVDELLRRPTKAVPASARVDTTRPHMPSATYPGEGAPNPTSGRLVVRRPGGATG